MVVEYPTDINIGKFSFDELLTFYDFSELHKAIEDVKEGRVIKPVLINSALRSEGAVTVFGPIVPLS